MTPGAPRAMPWRVRWQDFRGCHDFIGRRLLPKNAVLKPARARPPARQSRVFRTEEAARKFIQRLRDEIPPGELAVQLEFDRVEPPPPQQLRLADDWPLQRKQ